MASSPIYEVRQSTAASSPLPQMHWKTACVAARSFRQKVLMPRFQATNIATGTGTKKEIKPEPTYRRRIAQLSVKLKSTKNPLLA